MTKAVLLTNPTPLGLGWGERIGLGFSQKPDITEDV